MKIRNFMKQTSGVAAIEFAIIAPLLIIFTFGIIELGRALFQKQDLAAATDAAARLLYIDPTKADDVDALKLVIEENMFFVETGSVSVSFSGARSTVSNTTHTLTVTSPFQSLFSNLIFNNPINFTVEKQISLRQAP